MFLLAVEQIISPRGAALSAEEPRAATANRMTFEQIVAPKGPNATQQPAVPAPEVAQELPITAADSAAIK